MYRKNAAAHVEPRTQTHTLCEPAQSERMSRFHKSHFMRKFTGKMPRPSWIPQAGPALCASLRNSNTHQHFTRDIRRATLYRILQEKWRSPEWAQNADTHFVRACAVETHVKISQEPPCTEIYRKNVADQNRAADFVRACAVETQAKISQERQFNTLKYEQGTLRKILDPQRGVKWFSQGGAWGSTWWC